MATTPTSRVRDAALEAARTHQASGRLLDAVAELERAHREHPDVEFARRIVRLRREAAEAQPRTELPPRPEPEERADPFPDLRGAPEIDLGDLSGDVLGGAILHHGCLIVRGAIPSDRAEAMRDMVIRSIEARDRTIAEAPEPTDGRWYSLSKPRSAGTGVARRSMVDYGGMLAADSPLVLCDLLDAYEEAGVIAAIRDHLGEPPQLTVDKTVLRKVLASKAIWHQDGQFMTGVARAINVWLSLSDCGPGAATPSIDIVPTRIDQILETRTRGAKYSHIAIGQELLDEVAPNDPWITPRFSPGDAIMFDERFVHRSGSGEGYADHRYSVESWFFGGSRIPAGYAPLLA